MARGAVRVPTAGPPAALLAALLAVPPVAGTVVTGCGGPEYTYVKNSGERTYFKVPAGWKRIDQRRMDAAMATDDPDSAAARQRSGVTWSVAYDAHRDPDPGHLFGTGGDQPFVYTMVRPLSRAEQGAVSLDRLRDVFLPVTEERRRELAGAGAVIDGFELLRDDVLTPGGGLRGVRTTANYRLPDQPLLQTFDVTSYVSDEGRLYVMVVRCSARCYAERRAELDTVARSFTVRKQK
ncbi:hypothetical protein ACSNOI_28800 [Actinomadura kijaniata]|uniref:hypothetical protein n=1 Tax=Actinomadura kijaniata TaxID=46161 RepID=UPI003F1BC919